MIKLFVPGRLCLFGEHTDWAGHYRTMNADIVQGAAIVTGIEQGIYAEVEKSSVFEVKCSTQKIEGWKDFSCRMDEQELKRVARSGEFFCYCAGVASYMLEWYKVGGVSITITDMTLPMKSGLSSSAAFEVLVGTIIDDLFNDGGMGAVEIAKIGQFAENVYFGKASGLMDQMVCSVGGFVSIDFFNPMNPSINSVDFDFSQAGYSLCITNTQGSHADLTDEYVSVPAEMKTVANALDCEFLRDVDEDKFYSELPELRKSCSDRAILRAAHFFAENNRAVQEAEALEIGDTEEFFRLVNESGDSSANLLQNLYSVKNPQNQEIPLAIMISKRRLSGSGAVRVHGGGFAGTIQAFVRAYLADYYADEMNSVFGENSCQILSIRSVGGTQIKI